MGAPLRRSAWAGAGAEANKAANTAAAATEIVIGRIVVSLSLSNPPWVALILHKHYISKKNKNQSKNNTYYFTIKYLCECGEPLVNPGFQPAYPGTNGRPSGEKRSFGEIQACPSRPSFPRADTLAARTCPLCPIRCRGDTARRSAAPAGNRVEPFR